MQKLFYLKFVCVHVYACWCVCACADACEGQRGALGSSVFYTLPFETAFLTGLELVEQFRVNSWQAQGSACLCSHRAEIGSTRHHILLSAREFWGLNSSPHAFNASALPTEVSLQSRREICKERPQWTSFEPPFVSEVGQPSLRLLSGD